MANMQKSILGVPESSSELCDHAHIITKILEVSEDQREEVFNTS